MIYIFNDDASKNIIEIKGELFKYLIKVRRHSIGDEVAFRRRDDVETVCLYTLQSIGSRSATFVLKGSERSVCEPKRYLHIGWCIIDLKSIEKVLPTLNEIGVSCISFIYCQRSQRNIKLDFRRFERILEASMQQCGRTSYMKFQSYNNIKSFLCDYPDVKVFDFSQNILDASKVDFENILIGCEGGFSEDERLLLKDENIFRLDTPMVLRSESAVVAVASKVLI